MVRTLTAEPSDPLSFVRAMRAAQDEALARGLGFSAFAHLTVVVFALLLAVVLREPEVRSFDPPPYVDFPRDVEDYVPTSGGSPPVEPRDFDDLSVILPVLDEFVNDDHPVVHPNSGAIEARNDFEGTVGDGGSGGPVKGSGGPDGLPVDDTIPPPDVTTFVDEFPEIVKSVRPAYPEMARTAGLEGHVIVRMFVGVDGKIRKAEIERSSPMFDEAALEAARQWVFTPAKTNGQPVGVWVRVPIEFRLH
ncbi:MAG: energy transducer TonB [Candidatus Eiseniibacteriota bacterium]